MSTAPNKRRALSTSGILHARMHSYCDPLGLSISGYVAKLIEADLDAKGVPKPVRAEVPKEIPAPRKRKSRARSKPKTAERPVGVRPSAPPDDAPPEATPREKLRASLDANSAKVAAWPPEVRAAIDTSEVFAVASAPKPAASAPAAWQPHDQDEWGLCSAECKHPEHAEEDAAAALLAEKAAAQAVADAERVTSDIERRRREANRPKSETVTETKPGAPDGRGVVEF
jgi:hypothetical protein